MWKSAPLATLFSLASNGSWILRGGLTAFAKNTRSLSRSRLIGHSLRILAAALTTQAVLGGQAVLEGVVVRNGGVYSLAVRHPDGTIYAQRLRWRTFIVKPWQRLPFLRGFPALLEALVNGIAALNRSSALLAGGSATGKVSSFFSIALALLVAVGLFVIAPHVLSLLMWGLGLGGGVDSFSFHVWDGLFKCVIFVVYVSLISLVPDIGRVFQYHGAEHKIIHAYARGNLAFACSMSRFHPRCGTTFVLFVVLTAILLQAAFVPLLLKSSGLTDEFARQLAGIGIKLGLVIPISAIAYELIRFAAGLEGGWLARLLQAPGLALQRLTTREPRFAQLEVAAVALAEALDSAETDLVITVPYTRLDTAMGLEEI